MLSNHHGGMKIEKKTSFPEGRVCRRWSLHREQPKRARRIEDRRANERTEWLASIGLIELDGCLLALACRVQIISLIYSPFPPLYLKGYEIGES